MFGVRNWKINQDGLPEFSYSYTQEKPRAGYELSLSITITSVFIVIQTELST